MKRYFCCPVLFLVCCAAAGADSIFIPELHIPARHIPAARIPGVHIPAKVTPYGILPAIDLPEVYFPAIDIPAVDTTSFTLIYDDFTPAKLQEYRKIVPLVTPRPPKPEPVPQSDRVPSYLATTKWATLELARMFAKADTDCSGDLSWSEVEHFQRSVYSDYRYLANSTALRPDAFVAAGGGDCEDFALLTCEFFRFWGWPAFVAGFFDAKSGHAVCFVRAEVSVPFGYLSYRLQGHKTLEGDSIPDGTYVPVDYFAVGSYSGAVKAGMKLTEYFTPTRIYGVAM